MFQAKTVSACPNYTGERGGCLLFQLPGTAMTHVIESDPGHGPPTILAVGETHALAGTEGLQSTTARFREQLLPRLAAYRALVVEALIPPSGCKQREEQVRQETKQVTENQAQANQDEFLELANRAKAQGMTPYPLRLSCEDLATITTSEQGPIETSMQLIAHKTAERAAALIAAGGKPLLLYGGALHNDVHPLPGRERWSYAAQVGQLQSDSVPVRYVELDVITREFVAARKPWTELPWYQVYMQNCAVDGTLLIQNSERSYTLILPWQTEDAHLGCAR